jgi:hypothetical protein
MEETMRRRYVVALFTLVVAVGLLGCHRQRSVDWTFRSLAGSSAFLKQAKINHPECELVGEAGLEVPKFPEARNNGICRSIWKALDYQENAVNVANLYCAGPGWGDPEVECDPPTQDEAKEHIRARLEEAWKELQRIIFDLGWRKP